MKQSILIPILILTSAINIYACSCTEVNESLSKKVKREFFQSDLIFTGKVIGKKIKSNGKYTSSDDPVVYEFEIIKIIKGKVEHQILKVASARSGSSCGYSFKVGESYLVYANSFKEHNAITNPKSDFATGLCRRNQKLQLVKKKELKKLNLLYKRS